MAPASRSGLRRGFLIANRNSAGMPRAQEEVLPHSSDPEEDSSNDESVAALVSVTREEVSMHDFDQLESDDVDSENVFSDFDRSPVYAHVFYTDVIEPVSQSSGSDDDTYSSSSDYESETEDVLQLRYEADFGPGTLDRFEAAFPRRRAPIKERVFFFSKVWTNTCLCVNTIDTFDF